MVTELKDVVFYNGLKMPIVGFGTWQATPEEIETSLDAALKAGYRHIDTAFAYNNEDAIGRLTMKLTLSVEKESGGECYMTVLRLRLIQKAACFQLYTGNIRQATCPKTSKRRQGKSLVYCESWKTQFRHTFTANLLFVAIGDRVSPHRV
ncbi:unnamed protein product [Timema podura]|uniref:NADP-dependent oxidoreductase domain-containing protein n=1 Tax=Timema podura TaxID=61482 RepID=A0ABN7P8X7_TIMPD|nr:unnamed protein product [Timema podura]